MKKPIATIVWENALFPEQLDLERLLVRYAKVAELQRQGNRGGGDPSPGTKNKKTIHNLREKIQCHF